MKIESLLPGVNLESRNVEFKGVIREGRKSDGSLEETGWLKTLVAFANTDGGTLYIGVEDKTHKVVALDHQMTDRIILMIHRQIREKIAPKLSYEVDTIPVTGDEARYIIRVRVDVGKELPVTLHERGLLGIYVRNYGRTETATPEQIRDLILMSEQIPYDQPFTDKDYREEDFEEMFELARKRDVSISEKQLISIGFISPERKLSKGALLFMDRSDTIETQTTAALWPDFSKGSDTILAHGEWKGNLLDIIRQATSFVMNHSVNGFRKEAASRVNLFSYPERSVTEGIVNAAAHRNYFMKGTQVEINIFRDRLEITSPGSLPGVRKLEKEKNIASVIPRRRNEVICAALEMCRYMEKKGSGFDKIEEDYKNADEDHRPFISSDAASFTLTLPDLTYSRGVCDGEDSEVIPEVYAEKLLTGKKDLTILAYCYYTPRTVREIADHINVQPSTYFRRNTISRLVEQGLLIVRGDERPYRYQANRDAVKRQ